MNIVLNPLEGAVIGGKEIPFYTAKETVRQLLGEPEIVQGIYYYYDSELRLDFNERGELIWIECLGGIDGVLRPEIYGVSAFDTDADALCALLTEKNQGEIDDSEDGYSYGFLEISVGVYRDSTPEAVEESAAEAAECGESIDPDDYAEEMRIASHWATIGIGIRDYYRNV